MSYAFHHHHHHHHHHLFAKNASTRKLMKTQLARRNRQALSKALWLKPNIMEIYGYWWPAVPVAVPKF